MSDSFKIEDSNYVNKLNKKKKKKDIPNSSKIIVLAIVIVVCGIIGYGIYYYFNYVNFISKVDNSKPYIYTVEKHENPYQEDVSDKIPTINLVGSKFDRINKAIKDNYDKVSQLDEYDYGYEFSKSRNILALKITYAYYPSKEANHQRRYFETFNIDLRNGKILSNADILKKFNLSEKQVNSFMEAKFKAFYKDLVAGKFYTEKECNYECFLENRGITSNYLNNASYYIENGDLTLFKYYFMYSDYLEEQYLENVGYQFLIKE